MKNRNSQYYNGYEGETEIDFMTNEEEIVIWEGFFSDIMEQFKPSPNGWEGLPYYYHLVTGWYDESPWKIPDLKGCLYQLKQLDLTNCHFEESRSVHAEICRLLSNAIQCGEEVWIADN